MSEQSIKNDNLFYKDIIEPLQKEQKIQHAYLVETNSIEEIEPYITLLVETLFQCKLDEKKLTKEKLHTLIKKQIFPDLKILKPQTNVIKKEELLELKKSLEEKSVYNGYQIYLIYDAQKLNASSANTILKFLEEPEENIIAILVTNSRYQVLDTILSRCQVLSLPHLAMKKEKFMEETLLLFEKISHYKEKNLFFSYNELLEKVFTEKEKISKILDEIQILFSELLKEKYKMKKLEFISNISLQNLEEKQVLHILSVLQKKKEELQYNVNMKLWIDSFFLSLMEV